MVVILLITVLVVIFKVVFIDQDPDPNISTFRPLDQMVGSNIRYNGKFCLAKKAYSLKYTCVYQGILENIIYKHNLLLKSIQWPFYC